MTGPAEHDVVRDLVAAAAFGVATPEEMAQVERHVATCAVCAEELASMSAVGSMVGLSVPQVDPPPGLKGQVMAAVRAEPREASAAAAPARAARKWSLRPWPALAGALAAAVVGLGIWNLNLRDDGPSTLTPVQVSADVTASVRITEVDGRSVGLMRVTGLAEQAPGRGYEVWVIPPGGAPVSAGFMTRQADGSSVAVVDLAGADLVAVTPEARTNTESPTGEKVAVFRT